MSKNDFLEPRSKHSAWSKIIGAWATAISRLKYYDEPDFNKKAKPMGLVVQIKIHFSMFR